MRTGDRSRILYRLRTAIRDTRVTPAHLCWPAGQLAILALPGGAIRRRTLEYCRHAGHANTLVIIGAHRRLRGGKLPILGYVVFVVEAIVNDFIPLTTTSIPDAVLLATEIVMWFRRAAAPPPFWLRRVHRGFDRERLHPVHGARHPTPS